MASKYKKNKSNKILYAIVILTCFLILLAIILALSVTEKQVSQNTTLATYPQEKAQNVENDIVLAKLKDMEERERMEYYFGVFLDYIERSRYKSAYDLLYPEFKQNYFPTVESFEEYAKKTFPELTSIEHENIERNGDVYVLWIYITDALGPKDQEKKAMNIVIKENDYNDFVMSFSVI